MTDIVERLRNPSGIGEPMDHMAMEEAADEIERLRAALRAARPFVDIHPVMVLVNAALGETP